KLDTPLLAAGYLIGRLGRKYINSRRRRAGENPLSKYYRGNCRKNFREQKDIRQPISGVCVIFI
ncbi:hypothetical protein, partial [uncultured Acetatifactor sp.]|uniref:hypothetical protein n=1 Tax=uncultured Acetatifactor sp. TaxID=1671927 RepID=UPI0026234292